MPVVLVIEDDAVLARVIATHLRRAGLDVEASTDGDDALRRLRDRRPDLAVIDLMLPGTDGWGITETLRREGSTLPIIAVSARSAEHDRVHTLAIGVDDYLAKPFGMRELVARVQALLRRSTMPVPAAGDDLISAPGLRIEPQQRRAFVRVQPGTPEAEWPDALLTTTEFRLLVTLARAPRTVLTREDLQQRVWGVPYRHRDRIVDVCVRRIREKIDRRSASHLYVHTHRGAGYRFDPEEKATAGREPGARDDAPGG